MIRAIRCALEDLSLKLPALEVSVVHGRHLFQHLRLLSIYPAVQSSLRCAGREGDCGDSPALTSFTKVLLGEGALELQLDRAPSWTVLEPKNFRSFCDELPYQTQYSQGT